MRYMMRATTILFLMVLFLPLMVNAQVKKYPDGKKSILKIKPVADFEITGNHESKSWEGIDWIDLPIRKTNEVNYSTKVKLQYSEKGVYALYYCEDENITSTITQHQADIYKEDVVEIFFWTDEKYPIYFEYELSPLNYELVLMVPNMKGKFLGWIPWHYEADRKTRHKSTILKSGDVVTGWVAEFFIPFSLLAPLNNVPPVRGTKWRMNIYRIDYDRGTTTWTWQPVKTNFHEIESYGTLVFD